MPISLQEVVDQVRQNPKLIIADDFELSIQETTSRVRKFRNGEMSLASHNHGIWIGLRVIHRKRPGRSATFFRDLNSLSQLVDAAFESAKWASPDPWFRFPIWKSPKPGQGENRPELPEPTASFYPELRWTPAILEEVSEDWQTETLLHRRGEKFQLKDYRTAQGVHFSVMNHFGDHPFWLKEQRAFSRTIDTEERAAWLAGLLGRSYKRKAGSFFHSGKFRELLLSPSAVSTILERVSSWFRADDLQSGRSPIARFRNEKVFSEAISLVDDGKIDGGLNSRAFDLEGSQSQRTMLVENGLLKGAFFDTYFATRENRLSTGNLSRSMSEGETRLAPTNLFIPAGTASREALLQDSEHTLFLEEIQSLERVPGKETEFLVSGLGWRVMAGEVIEPVWQAAFRVDFLDLFRNAVKVGNDAEFYGAFGSPSILIKNLPLDN